MIAKYVKERGKRGKDPNLTLNKLYLVLGSAFTPGEYDDKIAVLRDQDDYPCFFDVNLFEIIDERVPPDWSLRNFGEGYLALRPNEFFGDFWDEYNDGDPKAEKLFGEVYEKIKKFHDWS